MNDRRVAGVILTNAKNHVTKDRGPQHGDVEPSFRMIAELWSVHINHSASRATGLDNVPPIHLSAWDVLQMMSMLKKARALYGDATLPDHYEDDAGYTALAAMLAGVDGKIQREVMAEEMAIKSRKLKEDMAVDLSPSTGTDK